MPSADAEALMTAVEDHATKTHRGQGGDGRLLGEHRAAALTELALRNVTLAAHLELIGTATSVEADAAGEDGSAGSVLLASKVGPIAAHDLSRVLAAHAGHRDKSITVANDPAIRDAHAATPAEGASPYRPPKALRESVIRRDGHFRFPGCPRPARFTDLDHLIPWPNGPTAPANLQCLCRGHHRTKQRGWAVTMTPDGRCTWISPTGRTHTTRPRSRTDTDDLTG